MALAAFAAQIGPNAKDYDGEYDWQPSDSCCARFAGSGELVALDVDTIQWRDVSASCCPSKLHPTHVRDPDNPEHFIGIGEGRTCYPITCCCVASDGVWVLASPNAPLQFYSTQQAAMDGKAPSITAMRRSDQVRAHSSAAAALAAESAGRANPKPSNAQGGTDGARYDAPGTGKQKTQAQMDREYKQAQKAEAKAAEKAAVAEAITNDRRAKKIATGRVPETSAEDKQKAARVAEAAERAAVAKAVASDKLLQKNKKAMTAQAAKASGKATV